MKQRITLFIIALMAIATCRRQGWPATPSPAAYESVNKNPLPNAAAQHYWAKNSAMWHLWWQGQQRGAFVISDPRVGEYLVVFLYGLPAIDPSYSRKDTTNLIAMGTLPLRKGLNLNEVEVVEVKPRSPLRKIPMEILYRLIQTRQNALVERTAGKLPGSGG